MELYFHAVYELMHFLSSGIQPLVDILERYGGWPVVKGYEWKSDTWDWLEMTKNLSSDGLPANFILEASVGIDHENTSQNIIQVK